MADARWALCYTTASGKVAHHSFHRARSYVDREIRDLKAKSGEWMESVKPWLAFSPREEMEARTTKTFDPAKGKQVYP